MSITTDTYLDVDGVPLQTMAYNITTWGSGRENPPPLRGTDIQIPGARGKRNVSKIEDSRTITLQMWVQGCTPDGGVPLGGSARAQFEFNWHKLRQLLYTPRRQLTLTKRFRDFDQADIDSHAAVGSLGYGQGPYGDGAYGGTTGVPVVQASGLAQYAGGLDISMTGRTRGIFSVDLLMDDPYFYGDWLTLPTMTANGHQGFQVGGHGRTNQISVEFDGTRANPQLTAKTPDSSMWVKHSSTGATGMVRTLDVQNFEAATYPSGQAGYSTNGLVSHGGDPFWLAFDPGANDLALTSTGGSGNVIVKYRTAWL